MPILFSNFISLMDGSASINFVALQDKIVKNRLRSITLVMKTYDHTDMKNSDSDEIHAANLACALRWHNLGLPVFWCREDKHPVSKWGAENSRAPSMAPSWLTDTHATWRQYRNPKSASERLPAIVVADRIIVDLDRHPGKADGVASFLALTADEPGRESWVVSKTAGSGLHLHFAPHPEIVGNSKKGLPAGIDIRAAGKGYAIACGTMRADGRRYQPLAGDPFVAGATLPPLPESLLALIRAARESIGANGAIGDGSDQSRRYLPYVEGQEPTGHERSYWASTLARACHEFRTYKRWTNQAFNDRVFGLFQIAWGWGCDINAVRSQILAAATAWNPNGAEEYKIRATVDSAIEGARNHPRGLLKIVLATPSHLK
ncbi:bifunctional DNA primase/polymerase [Bosea sp. NPDC055353]